MGEEMQNLLQQTPPQQEQPPQQANPQQPEQQGEFTIDSIVIEDGLREQMNDKQQKNMDKVLAKGHEMLFSNKDTHYQLIDSLKGLDGDALTQGLGEGGANMAKILVSKSGNTLPGDVLVPAGIVLMARASEFLNESKLANVTDDIFGNAVQMFTEQIQAHFKPDEEAQQPVQPEQQMQQPIGGGLLDQTGA